MNRAAGYGTAIVLVHLLVNIIHGEAHRILKIDLGPFRMMFVIAVILVGPLVAMVNLWISRRRFGLMLLALSMAGSLVFGLYDHFVASGPDNVTHQPHETWGSMFVLTAWLLLLTEAAGALFGLSCHLRSRVVFTR
jgi:hypothetical protein